MSNLTKLDKETLVASFEEHAYDRGTDGGSYDKKSLDNARAELLRRLSLNDELVSALTEVGILLARGQGDWSGVSQLYAPEWTHGYKAAEEIVDAALAKALPEKSAHV